MGSSVNAQLEISKNSRESEASYHRALDEEEGREHASSSSEMSLIPFSLMPRVASPSSFSASSSSAHSSMERESQPPKLLSSNTRLNSLPPEILGLIARDLEVEDMFKLQRLTGDRALQMKTHTLSFYQKNDKVMACDLGILKIRKMVEHFLKEAPAGANINLWLKNSSRERLDLILPYFDKVKGLDFTGNLLGDDVVEVLVNSPYVKNLTFLNLAGSNIGVEGAVAMATSPYLMNLTFLNLRFNSIDDVKKELIKARYPFAQL